MFIESNLFRRIGFRGSVAPPTLKIVWLSVHHMMRWRAVGKGDTYTFDLLTSKWFHEFQRRTSISYIKFQLLNTLFLSANPCTERRDRRTECNAQRGCLCIRRSHNNDTAGLATHTDIKFGGLKCPVERRKQSRGLVLRPRYCMSTALTRL